MSIFVTRILLMLLAVGALASYQTDSGLPFDLPQTLTEDPLTAGDQAKITALSSSLDWLGPLAPIAISPFFGITILCGLSQFGGGILPDNSFISNNPVLQNPAVFWVFLGLTVLTSLPRFTKVSKPAAQAIDQLEAYAGIITIVLIRLLSTLPSSSPETAMVIEMGVLSFSADVLLSIAAIINIFVINTVKFFFEVMVWLMPVPFVDAILEVCNKSLCAGLMAIYVWSPLVATILNLILFVVCLLAFRWIYRRVKYMRTLLCDPVWAMVNRQFGIPTKSEIVVFPQKGSGLFAAKSKLLLQTNNEGWQLVESRWLRPPRVVKLSRNDYQLSLKTGMLLNTIEVKHAGARVAESQDDPDVLESGKFLFSRRYASEIDSLASLMGVEMSKEEAVEIDLRAEFGSA